VRIVFDQGTPAPLRLVLDGHEVSTAFELGWSRLDNGELLAAAEGEFDLRAHCRTQLAAYKLPRVVAFVPELPKTASGTVQRFVLRAGG